MKSYGLNVDGYLEFFGDSYERERRNANLPQRAGNNELAVSQKRYDELENRLQRLDQSFEILKLQHRVCELEKRKGSVELVEREIHRSKKKFLGYSNETEDIRERIIRRKR